MAIAPYPFSLGFINFVKVNFTLTVSGYPTFWVYLLYLLTNLCTGEFVFQDEKGKDIYRTALRLAEKSGVMASVYLQVSNML
ncbi:DUF928 domain-containing protein [Nostoc sp. CHAB 5834]|nr:DUF928 domain-containing protein [Nostoc sp. CHAB 5834]